MKTWQDMNSTEKTEAVKALKLKGLSGGQMALRLKTSRSAIMGAVYRAKIKLDTSAGSRRKTCGYERVPKPRAPRPPKPKLPPKPVNEFLAPTSTWRDTPAFDPLPDSTPVTLTELSAGCCKWPVGSSPTLFCALPADGSYCHTHASWSRQ